MYLNNDMINRMNRIGEVAKERDENLAVKQEEKKERERQLRSQYYNKIDEFRGNYEGRIRALFDTVTKFAQEGFDVSAIQRHIYADFGGYNKNYPRNNEKKYLPLGEFIKKAKDFGEEIRIDTLSVGGFLLHVQTKREFDYHNNFSKMHGYKEISVPALLISKEKAGHPFVGIPMNCEEHFDGFDMDKQFANLAKEFEQVEAQVYENIDRVLDEFEKE